MKEPHITEPPRGFRIIGVGVSAGGLSALRLLLSGLPSDFDVPIVIVQHRSKESELLCELLQECSPMPVREVTDKEDVRRGHIYIAPPDYHVLVEDGQFALSVDEPVRYSRPSIDVTFESIADEYGPDAIGIVLTGANADGSRGLRKIVDRGGYAVVQDPETAEVKMMPQAAAQAVAEACVLPMKEIAAYLTGIRGRRFPPCGSHT